MRTDERLLVGLDEAGRGSLVGPLVVGAFAIAGPLERADRLLKDAGAMDSKALKPSERDDVLARLRGIGNAVYAAAQPRIIDSHVAKNGLNRLELNLMARLVKRTGAASVYVDACDTDEARFGRDLGKLCGPGVRVVSRHKADRDIPIVGAGSVVAKVMRDRAILKLARSEGRDIGSGYPSDEVTREYVRGLIKKGPLPRWVRRSWSTVDTLKRELYIHPLEAYG